MTTIEEINLYLKQCQEKETDVPHERELDCLGIY